MVLGIKNFVSDYRFKNYMTLVVALKFTKDGLKEYIENEISKFYVRLSNKCAGFLPCNINCTKTNSTRNTEWCNTCKKWRSEFHQYMRYPGQVNRVKWDLFDSKTWGRDSTQNTLNQIMNVYVHQCRDPTGSTMDDIINIVSLFENCLYFDIGSNKQLLRNVRVVRNQHFAHNKRFMVEDKDLKKCLQTLGDFLQHKPFQNNEKCREAVKLLMDLKKENRHQNEHVIDLQNKFSNKNFEYEDMSRQVNTYFKAESSKTSKADDSFPGRCWYINYIVPITILCSVVAISYFPTYFKKPYIGYSPIVNKGKIFM